MKFIDSTNATKADYSLDGFRLRMISSYRKGTPELIWDEIERSSKKEVCREELLRFNQANLARQLKLITGARRLLGEGQPRKTDEGKAKLTGADMESHDRKIIKSKLARLLTPIAGAWKLLGKGQSEETTTSKKLQLESDEHKIIKLTKVRFVYKVGYFYIGFTTGTLEGHVNGFLYKSDSGHLQIDILYEKIDNAFCLVEDDMRLPLLHFSLRDHIMVWGKKITDIQFHRFPDTPGDAFLNFAIDAQILCGYPIEKLEMKYKFQGVLSGNNHLSSFYLTFFSLVRLEEEPSVIARLCDIEIVNLAEAGPGTIDMAVILKDFKSDILQINSISVDSLALIKHQLDAADVKFYVNNFRQDWKVIIQDIITNPGNFIKNGGWDNYDLEQDGITLDYYSDSSHDEYCLNYFSDIQLDSPLETQLDSPLETQLDGHSKTYSSIHFSDIQLDSPLETQLDGHLKTYSPIHFSDIQLDSPLETQLDIPLETQLDRHLKTYSPIHVDTRYSTAEVC